MDCRNCGTQIAPTDHFCHVCGTPSDKPSSFFHQREGTSPQITKNRVFGVNKKLVAVFAFVLAFGVVFTIFGILPRINTLSSLKSTRENLTETSTKTAKVNQALEAVYNYVTKAAVTTRESKVSSKQSVSTIKLLATSTTEEAPQLNLLTLKTQINEATTSMKNKKVKGFSTPATDPLKAYRDLRDLAQNAKQTTKEGLDSLSKLTKAKQTQSAQLSQVTDSLTKITSDTEDYLLESEKTANYYTTYTDAFINLSSVILDSLQATTATQVNTNLDKAKKIQDQMQKVGDLPGQISSFHKDILEEISGAVSFLDSFTTLALSNDAAASDKATAAAQKWIDQEKALALRIQSDQLNFWKTNETLAGFEFLSSSQADTLKKLEVERQNNSLFLLTWIGIK